MSVFPGPVTWAVTSRVSPSSFLKLAPVYCLSVFLLRCSGKAGGLAQEAPSPGWDAAGEAHAAQPLPRRCACAPGRLWASSRHRPHPRLEEPGPSSDLRLRSPPRGECWAPRMSPRWRGPRWPPAAAHLPPGAPRRRARRMRPGDRLSRSRLRLCLSLQISGWRLALQPRSSGGSEKSHRFSVCPAFPPVVRTGVTISSSHASELKRESDGFFSPRFAQFCHPRQDAGSRGWRSLAHDL